MPLLLNAFTTVFDQTGRLAIDAILNVYEAGTSEPAEIYLDAGFNNPAPNPIATDFGVAPAIYVDGGQAYRVYATSPDGAVYRDFDQIYIDEPGIGGGGGGGGPAVGFVVGDWKFRYAIGAHPGWVRANGRTIGSAGSGATERANDDCQALFIFLWEADATLPVTPSRGANAAADWAANKTIGLPDCRFRVPTGLDNMGGGAAGRSAGANFDSGSGTALGSYGGAATSTLAIANLPAHAHNVGVTVNPAGSHSHTGTTSAEPAHTHGGSTANEAAHTHAGSTANEAAHTHTWAAPQGKNGTAGSGSAINGLWFGGDPTNTSADGAHNHTFTTNPGGAHSHTFTTNPGGGHSHTFTTSIEASHAHTASASCSNVGSGTGFSIMSPFILGTWHIFLGTV